MFDKASGGALVIADNDASNVVAVMPGDMNGALQLREHVVVVVAVSCSTVDRQRRSRLGASARRIVGQLVRRNFCVLFSSVLLLSALLF